MNVAVFVGVFVDVGVKVAVFVGVGVKVAVAVAVFVGVGVNVAVFVGVFVDVGVKVAVFVGVFVDVGVKVAVFVGVGVKVGVGTTSVANRLNASTLFPLSPQVLPSKYSSVEKLQAVSSPSKVGQHTKTSSRNPDTPTTLKSPSVER